MRLLIPPRWRDPQSLVAAGVDFLDEAAGVQAHDLVALLVEHGVAKVELFLGAGHGHVEEAALFFEVPIVDRALEWEGAVGQADDEDDRKLQAFGLVDGGEAEAILLLFGAALITLGGEEHELREQLLHRFVARGEADEALQVVGAVRPVGVDLADVTAIPTVECELNELLRRFFCERGGEFAERLSE